ncbi:MAG: aspartyl-phosphate phosphatase Spo0E family protein [Mahellales bacterium]|jgi:hypothetical protein
MDRIKLERDIKKAREELNYLIRINGYNLLSRDILVCSKRLDSLLTKYQRLYKCSIPNDRINPLTGS